MSILCADCMIIVARFVRVMLGFVFLCSCCVSEIPVMEHLTGALGSASDRLERMIPPDTMAAKDAIVTISISRSISFMK